MVALRDEEECELSEMQASVKGRHSSRLDSGRGQKKNEGPQRAEKNTSLAVPYLGTFTKKEDEIASFRAI